MTTHDDVRAYLYRVACDVALTQARRATYWRRSALLTWAVNVALGFLLWWRW